jgi:hypothetical protein
VSTTPNPHFAATAAGLAALALSVVALPAAAEPLAVVLTSHAERVSATIDLSPVLPPKLEEELGNGLRNVVAIFVAVVPVASGQASHGSARVVEVLYDVWEETWVVTTRDAGSPSGRRQTIRSRVELGQLLARAADVELGTLGSLPAGRFALEVRIDVNPVSPELLERTREYLAASAGPAGASRSVLGTVAGFLLRGPGDDGRIFLFRSRLLTAAEVIPR